MRVTRSILATAMAAGSLCVAVDANAGYTDTVDLGTLPSDSVSLQLFNSYMIEPTPTSEAQYSNATQQFGQYGGSGPLVSGVLSGAAAGAPSYIYEFSTSGNFKLSGEVDGPAANFQSVLLYAGTPTGPSTLLSTGQYVLCSVGCGGYSYTSLSGAGGKGSFYIELSDPRFPGWSSPPQQITNNQYLQLGDAEFSLQLTKAPELDTPITASAFLLLLSCLAIVRGRRNSSSERSSRL